MITDQKIFYKTYLSEYHWYKIRTLKLTLDNHKEFFEKSVHKKPNSEELERYLRMVKLEMRHTYFHCMETMFTLLIALDPFKYGFNDEDLFQRITTIDIDYVYSRIKTFAADENGLKFLKKKMRYGNTKSYPHVGKYIFYRGIAEFNPKFSKSYDDFEQSIEAIVYGLKLLAIDFSERDEYNSFKHGLRLVHNIDKIILADAKTFENQIEFDVKDSVSFYKRQKSIDKSESVESITRVFDTERDYQMTTFCSNLISSMIESRRTIHFKDSLREDGIPIRFFDKDPIDKCATANPNASVWTHKITKTKSPENS